MSLIPSMASNKKADFVCMLKFELVLSARFGHLNQTTGDAVLYNRVSET